jgi:hypothetical protein
VKREPHRFAAIRGVVDDHREFRASMVPTLIDVDRVVSDYCSEHQIEFPVSVDEKIDLHLRAIEERLATIAAHPADSSDAPMI